MCVRNIIAVPISNILFILDTKISKKKFFFLRNSIFLFGKPALMRLLKSLRKKGYWCTKLFYLYFIPFLIYKLKNLVLTPFKDNKKGCHRN